MIAEIIPLLRLPKALTYFDYKIPSTLEGNIKIGQLVGISFRNKMVGGLVFNIKNSETDNKWKIKEISKIWNEDPELDENYLKLFKWISEYFLTPLPLLAKTFIPLPPLRTREIKIKKKTPPLSPSISGKDVNGVKNILQNFHDSKNNIFLLHYQNKKNKTAVYLKIISETVKKNKQVLILMPQITDIEELLPHLDYFFANKIALLHGELLKTEYWQEWQKIKSGKAMVAVGTRSAIFAPCKNLGLIIIDGEEASDFKQSDRNPRYDARIVAMELARLTGTKVLLGSQTPRIETYHKTKNSEIKLLSENKKDNNNYLSVDMGQEIKKKNFSPISSEIKNIIEKNFNNKKKSVLLLNKRGSSNMVACRDCEHVFSCKDCGKPLVYHEDATKKLICHNCGYKEVASLNCPKCRGVSLKFIGAGTEKVEKEIKKLFPAANVLRIDKDAMIKEAGDADIYIGTEFFIKNYLPQINNIDLVAIISADSLIFRPDFRSGEKTFEWVTKIMNISDQKKSLFILQTFYPDNYIFKLALKREYEFFFNEELTGRKNFSYPPFGKLIKLTYSSKNERMSNLEIFKVRKFLTDKFIDGVEILGDGEMEKTKQKFSSKIVLKSSENFTSELLEYLKNLPDGWAIDIDPESLL